MGQFGVRGSDEVAGNHAIAKGKMTLAEFNDGEWVSDPKQVNGIFDRYLLDNLHRGHPLGSGGDARNAKCPCGHFKVALFTYFNPLEVPQDFDDNHDWHWMTQHVDGTWSQKFEDGKASRVPTPTGDPDAMTIGVHTRQRLIGYYCLKGRPRSAWPEIEKHL